MLLSEYLVRTWLIETERLSLKESAMIIRSSLIDEWWRNKGSHKLSWMLKSLVITNRLWMLISVSLRYFIVEWEESEYTFMIQKSLLLMKKEARRISLWSIMSLWKEKRNDVSLTLMKMATLGHSFVISGSLANVSQLGWLTMPTNGTPSLSAELEIDLIVVYNGSWINIISKLLLTSRIVFITRLFFLTFCEKILRLFKIIL